MSADTKSCGCLCKQGTAARGKDQSRDIHPKPQTSTLGRRKAPVLAPGCQRGHGTAPEGWDTGTGLTALPPALVGSEVAAVPELPAGTGGTEAPASAGSGIGLSRGDKGGDSEGGQGETGSEEQDQWREEIASRQSRHAPADAASPPERLLGVFPAPTIRRGCALTRELRSRSHSQGNGISLPILAPPSPFVSFLHPFQFCLHWMRYFGQQSFGKQCPHCAGRALSSPAALPRSGAVAAGTARGCGLSAPRSCSRRSCRTPAAPATPCWRSWTSPSDLELFAMFLHKT